MQQYSIKKPVCNSGFFLKNMNSEIYTLLMSTFIHSYIHTSSLGSKLNWKKTQCHNVYCFWETEAFFLAFPHNDYLHVQCNLWCTKGLPFKLLYTLICGILIYCHRAHFKTLLLCLGPSFCTCSNLGQIVYSNVSVQRGRCLQILKSKERPIFKSDCTSIFVLYGTCIPGFIKIGVSVSALAQLALFIPTNSAVRVSSVDVSYNLISLWAEINYPAVKLGRITFSKRKKI